jgi:hypothetical protein
MRDEADISASPGPEDVTTSGAPTRELAGRPPAGGSSEPVLVELAWLVIEGAVFVRRLRALLARI